MKTVRRLLVAATLLSLSVSAEAQSMRHCRAKPQLLELGAPLPIAREAVTELKHLRIRWPCGPARFTVLEPGRNA